MVQRVGVDPLLLQGARRGRTGSDVLVEQMAGAETCELVAALVCEQRHLGRRAFRCLLGQRLQSSGGSDPDGSEPFLGAVAVQSDLALWLGPNVAQL